MLSNPLINSEENIIKALFGSDASQMKAYKSLLSSTAKDIIKVRLQLDADIYEAAQKKDYDAIAIVTEKGFEKIQEGKLPKSVELNVFNVNKTSLRWSVR